MGKLLRCTPALLAGFLLAPKATAQEPESSCVTCHAAFGDERLSGPVESYPNDVHAAQGFDCVACHGGDATVAGMGAMDPAAGYLGVPEGEDVLSVCGRCHSSAQFMRRYDPSLRVDQVAEYRTSVHGQRLLQQGDDRVATCSSCHPAHAIKPPSDPNSSVHPLNVAATCADCHANPEYMSPYPIPTDQHEKYLESIHWEKLSVARDLSAPTCNDCHGNHGAAPPGVSWVGNVCGQCHSVMAERFNQSFHSRIFAMLGNPGCATCHNNHEIKLADIEMLGVDEGSVCGRCHSAESRGGIVATRMRTLIDSLSLARERADSILERAENAGMEVSQAQFDLNGATTALVSARTAVHSFDVEGVREEVESGLEVAAQAWERGQEAMDDLRFRRTGLAISVGIIVLLIIGLVLKIRQLEPAGAGPSRKSAPGGEAR
ncbi:MAG: hypothetical protein GWN99_05320 [Gemmatimonadetes bacterium]|nr:hypothetical protein [Gemmatimonadota bacterium]NIS00485.1 hypothetical protein [Gemmatimonadota bacterium]NIT66143.1 hypothetical protein [Gemmatimonadota bacterium]NIU54221.1 hypothetical protein [Gemmatimonadota bacterium]NIV22711.1 hypothetical protein [Gemmatimonadota bacterium]